MPLILEANAALTCVLDGAVVAKGKNRDAQISQVKGDVRPNSTIGISTLPDILHSPNIEVSDDIVDCHD